MTREEELQEIVDDLGVDIDVNSETSIEVDQNKNTQVKTKEITFIQPVPPESDEVGDYTENKLLQDGSQVSITVRKRPKCPSCGYIPTEEDDPLHLTGRSSITGKQTCPKCKVECSVSGRMMSRQDSHGYGPYGEPVHPDFVDEVEEDVEHQRSLEELEYELRQQQQELKHEREQDRINKEHQRKKQKQKKELELEEKWNEFEQMMEVKEQELEEEIEKRKLELEEMKEIQEQELREKEAKLKEKEAELKDKQKKFEDWKREKQKWEQKRKDTETDLRKLESAIDIFKLAKGVDESDEYDKIGAELAERLRKRNEEKEDVPVYFEGIRDKENKRGSK